MSALWDTFTEDDRSEFKKWLNDHLRYGEVTVVFNKKDGEKRTMKCTLNPDMVPQLEKKTERVKEVNEDVCPVYDLDKQGWRSFRYDSVTEVNFEIKRT
jgi:hypothetical protein